MTARHLTTAAATIAAGLLAAWWLAVVGAAIARTVRRYRSDPDGCRVGDEPAGPVAGTVYGGQS